MITMNPELQSLIPPLTPEEYAQLGANIVADGCRDPLIVWQEEQTLLDGHNRYEICERHGLPYTTIEVSLPDMEHAKAWMIDQQLGRRNLTPQQMSYYRGKQYEYQKQVGFKGNQYTSASGKSYQKQDTAKALAAQHHVAEKTIRNDAAYAKAIDTIAATVGLEARQTLLARETKVTQQEVKTLAKVATTHALTAKEALEAVNGAKTPKQARQMVREVARKAREYGQYMDAMTRSEGLAVWPPPPERTAPSDGLAVRFRQTLRAMEVLHTCLKMVAFPDALDPHMEACIAFGKAYRQIERLLGKHTAVRQALFGVSPGGPKTAPRPKTSTPQADGGRTKVVERMAPILQQFTCPELAKKLGEDRRAVKLVLTRKVRQGKVKKEGAVYTWIGHTPSVTEAS